MSRLFLSFINYNLWESSFPKNSGEVFVNYGPGMFFLVFLDDFNEYIEVLLAETAQSAL